MLHCNLLSKGSNPTSLRQQPVEIERDQNDFAIDYISDVKVNKWPSRRGLYLQLLICRVVIMLLNGCYWNTWMSVINFPCLSHQMFGHTFPQTRAYVQFKTRHPTRDVDLNEQFNIESGLKWGVLWGRDLVLLLSSL